MTCKVFVVFFFSDDWYGMMYSYADSKKKSSLMLSVFEPGLINFENIYIIFLKPDYECALCSEVYI